MPSTNSTFDIGTFNSGSWRCACNRSPAWRTVHKEGPTKGERFLRCAPPPGERDTQCSFFLWEAHRDDAETTMRQRNMPIVSIPGLTPMTPRTPSPPARSQSPSILSSTSGTLTPGPSPPPSATSTLPKNTNAASTASSLSFFGTQTSSQPSTLFGSQPFGQNNKLFSTLANPPSSTLFGSQPSQPHELFKSPSIPSGTLFSSQATAKPNPFGPLHIAQPSSSFNPQPIAQPSGLFGSQPNTQSTAPAPTPAKVQSGGLFGTQPNTQSAIPPAPQVRAPPSAQAPATFGMPTPEKTPHKQNKQLLVAEEDSSEVLTQITSRLSADGVPLKPSTEEYLGHILREEIAIYEAKLKARDVTIARLMQQIDRLTVKGF